MEKINEESKEMGQTNIAHSLINSYPPNINKFPKFYNAREHLFILHPGDMIYIPPGWFHWIHSYPDVDENLAISFPATEYNPPILNQFSIGEPFIYSLDKNTHSFLSITKDQLKASNSNTHKSLVSKSNILIPVNKKKPVPWRNLNISDAENLVKEGNFISFGQSCSMLNNLKVKPPSFLLGSFPRSVFTSCFWLYLYPKDMYIDTGLHFDHNPNVLIQIKGKKIIRMYSPDDSNNLYLSPFKMV